MESQAFLESEEGGREEVRATCYGGRTTADSEDEGRGVSTEGATQKLARVRSGAPPRVSGEDYGPTHTSAPAQGAPTTVRQEIQLFQALDGGLFTAALRCAKAQASTGFWGLRRRVPHYGLPQPMSVTVQRGQPGPWGVDGGTGWWREVGSLDLEWDSRVGAGEAPLTRGLGSAAMAW